MRIGKRCFFRKTNPFRSPEMSIKHCFVNFGGFKKTVTNAEGAWQLTSTCPESVHSLIESSIVIQIVWSCCSDWKWSFIGGREGFLDDTGAKPPTVGGFATAFYSGLWAYDGWNNLVSKAGFFNSLLILQFSFEVGIVINFRPYTSSRRKSTVTWEIFYSLYPHPHKIGVVFC